MKSNRREAIKKALGLTAAAAAGLAIRSKSEASTEGQVVWAAMPLQADPPTTYTPPPPDTRSPREVWQDRQKQYDKWLDGIVNNNEEYRSYNRQIEHVSGRTYLKLKDKLKARGMAIDEQVMGGDTFLVIHGNLYTIGQWW